MRGLRTLLWLGIGALGALAFGAVALHRGEHINALWLVTAAFCTVCTTCPNAPGGEVSAAPPQ